MPWSAAAAVAGSVISSSMQADAAGGAAGDSNAGLLQAIEELRAADKRTRSDTAPYRNLGSNSVNRLSYLLGVAPIAGGNDPYAGQDIVTMSGGVPTYNADLYNSDPAYRKAWDQVASGHYAKYNSNYTDDSDVSWIDGQVRSLLPQATDLDTSDGQYGSLLKGFTQDDLNKDVVYNTGLQFGLDQGTRALANRARASGGTDSGSVLKALTRYGNDYATTKAGDAYNRFNTDKTNTYNMLSGGTNIGQNAVNTSANSGSAIGSAIAGAQNSIGQNNAAARIGESNAWGNALKGITSAVGSYYGGTY